MAIGGIHILHQHLVYRHSCQVLLVVTTTDFRQVWRLELCQVHCWQATRSADLAWGANSTEILGNLGEGLAGQLGERLASVVVLGAACSGSEAGAQVVMAGLVAVDMDRLVAGHSSLPAWLSIS